MHFNFHFFRIVQLGISCKSKEKGFIENYQVWEHNTIHQRFIYNFIKLIIKKKFLASNLPNVFISIIQ